LTERGARPALGAPGEFAFRVAWPRCAPREVPVTYLTGGLVLSTPLTLDKWVAIEQIALGQ